MPLLIRKATALDIPVLIEMMGEFYAEANYPLDHEWARTTFTALLANESYGAIWLVTSDSAPAGYIVLAVHFSMEYGGLSGSIEDLFVRPAYRRQGAGKIAVQTLIDDCKARGLLAVQVETGPDNTPAQFLYEIYALALRDDQRLTFTRRLTP